MKQEPKVEIFVYYPIQAINPNFGNSLSEYLLDNVWGDRREAEEHVSVTSEHYWVKSEPLNLVRYQFGDFYNAETYKDEVGELINEHFDKWVAIHSDVEDSIFA